MQSSQLSNEGYTLISGELIRHLMGLIRSDVSINAAANFRINDLLGGRILFNRDGEDADEIPDSETLSQPYATFVRSSMLQLFALGFTACKSRTDTRLDEQTWNEGGNPNADLIPVEAEMGKKRKKQRRFGPTGGWETGTGPYNSRTLERRDFIKARGEDLLVDVLNLEMLDVWWRVDVFNKHTFRFFLQDNGRRSMEALELTRVFWLVTDAPVRDFKAARAAQQRRMPFLINMATNDGDTVGSVLLPSIVSRLLEDTNLIQHNRLCHQVSTINMSNPAIVLEDQPQAPNADDSLSAGIDMGTIGGGGASHSDPDPVVIGPNLQMEYERRIQCQRDQEAAQIAGSTYSSSSFLASVTETTMISAPNAKKVAKPNAAQPVPYMMELLRLQQEKVWNAFEIPLAVQLNVNPVKTNTMEVGTASGAQHEGRESTGKEVFRNTQSGLRQRLTEYAQLVIDYMTFFHRTLGYAAEQMDEENEDWHSKRQKKEKPKGDKYRIRIILPGMPNADEALSLYKFGMMKYEACISIQSTARGILKTAFHKQSQLTLQEVNGIQEEEEMDPSDAGKLLSEQRKPKKSKAKAKKKK